MLYLQYSYKQNTPKRYLTLVRVSKKQGDKDFRPSKGKTFFLLRASYIFLQKKLVQTTITLYLGRPVSIYKWDEIYIMIEIKNQ